VCCMCAGCQRVCLSRDSCKDFRTVCWSRDSCTHLCTVWCAGPAILVRTFVQWLSHEIKHLRRPGSRRIGQRGDCGLYRNNCAKTGRKWFSNSPGLGLPLHPPATHSRRPVSLVPAPTAPSSSTCGLLDQLTPGLSTELTRCFLRILVLLRGSRDWLSSWPLPFFAGPKWLALFAQFAE